MSDFIFNIGRGRIHELIDNSETLDLMVLKASDTEDNMADVDTVAALLALGAVTEADFTNYTRKTLASVTATVDDQGTDGQVDFDAADVTFTDAGNGTNNTTTHAIIYWDVDDTDANAIPLYGFDAVFTTNGGDVTLQVHADGFAFA